MSSILASAKGVAVASGSFWSSDTFWAATGVVVALVVGVAGVYVAYRAALPKRRLVYSFGSSALIQRHQRTVSTQELSIYLGGRPLIDPHLVSLRLENTGRLDISSAQFDQGGSLRVDFGLPVVELVSAVAEPPGAYGLMPNDWGAEGVTIPPGRLGRGEAITYTLLVEGDPSRYQFTHPLIDVTVKEKFSMNWNVSTSFLVAGISEGRPDNRRSSGLV